MSCRPFIRLLSILLLVSGIAWAQTSTPSPTITCLPDLQLDAATGVMCQKDCVTSEISCSSYQSDINKFVWSSTSTSADLSSVEYSFSGGQFSNFTANKTDGTSFQINVDYDFTKDSFSFSKADDPSKYATFTLDGSSGKYSLCKSCSLYMTCDFTTDNDISWLDNKSGQVCFRDCNTKALACSSKDATSGFWTLDLANIPSTSHLEYSYLFSGGAFTDIQISQKDGASYAGISQFDPKNLTYYFKGINEADPGAAYKLDPATGYYRICPECLLSCLQLGTCPIFVIDTPCGNGVMNAGEACDDGNTSNGDGCDSSCNLEPGCGIIPFYIYSIVTCGAVCGNTILEAGEQCDDGNVANGDGCSATCQTETPSPACGDGIVNGTEQCDDGNTTSGDGCNGSCQTEPPLFTCFACGASNACQSFTGVDAACTGFFGDLPGCQVECEDTPPPPDPGVDCFACGTSGACTPMTASPEVCNNFFSDPICGGTCDWGGGLTDTDPTPEDEQYCTDPTSVPPGFMIRDYGADTHISSCETETSVRYVICSDIITINIIECEAGDPCENGACIDSSSTTTVVCGDTDGLDPNTGGTVVGIEPDGDAYIQNDYCIGSTAVVEYSCQSDNTSTVSWISCADGWYCQVVSGGGDYCVPGAPPTCTPGCVDSDGGINPDVDGGIAVVQSNCSSYTSSDGCASTFAIQEYYCQSDETGSFTSILCPSGEVCNSGICNPACTPTCTDSDDGVNTSTYGIVSGASSSCTTFSSTDECQSSGFVIEKYCAVGGALGQTVVACGSGQICDNGACVTAPACTTTCSRTEATASAAGFVSQVDCVVQHDICQEDPPGVFSLIKFQCNATSGMAEVSETITCPAGCANGLCQ